MKRTISIFGFSLISIFLISCGTEVKDSVPRPLTADISNLYGKWKLEGLQLIIDTKNYSATDEFVSDILLPLTIIKDGGELSYQDDEGNISNSQYSYDVTNTELRIDEKYTFKVAFTKYNKLELTDTHLAGEANAEELEENVEGFFWLAYLLRQHVISTGQTLVEANDQTKIAITYQYVKVE